MEKFFSILLVLILLFSNIGVAELKAKDNTLVEYDKKIEGYITKVDLEGQLVFINEIKYYLTRGSLLSLNDRLTSLYGLKPPAPGFYIWAEIYLDSYDRILKIDAYYKVVEGIIEEISYIDNSIVLTVYQQGPDSGEGYSRYFFQGKNKVFFNIKEKDHVILITARDKILSIY